MAVWLFPGAQDEGAVEIRDGKGPQGGVGDGGQHGEVQDEGVVDDQRLKGVVRYGGQQREV